MYVSQNVLDPTENRLSERRIQLKPVYLEVLLYLLDIGELHLKLDREPRVGQLLPF